MTNWMPAARLANARRRQSDAMTETCDIYSPDSTRATTGGFVNTPDAAATDVAFFLKTIQPGSRDLRGNVVVGTPVINGKLPHDQTVTLQQTIVHNSITYKVQSVNNEDTWRTATIVTLEPIRSKPK